MLYEFKGKRPKIGRDVFLAPGVIVLGDVEIGAGSNLWFYTVARGDVHSIVIGTGANIQDHCMLHVTGGKFPLTIGDGVIVGHRAVLHGCTVQDRALVGIGALVLDGAVVEERAMVAAGAVVAPGSIIPAGKVAVGVPAKPIRDATPEELDFNVRNAENYGRYGREFSRIVEPVWSD
jgi:carbonic anhydrase/acetyltransferase-like protein (isoleucine patch superfamily)